MGLRDNFRQAIDEMIGAKPNDLTVSDEQIANGQALAGQEPLGDPSAAEKKQPEAPESGVKGHASAPVKSLSNLGIRPGQNAGAKTIITLGTVIKGDLASRGGFKINVIE